MTDYTATRSKNATLTANTVDVITFDQPYTTIEVINWDTTARIMVTIDLGANNEQTLTPTVSGDGCWVVGPGAVRAIRDDTITQSAQPSRIRLISTTAAQYTATGTATR